ncbi:hypothetical protein JKP88DRAFT_262930, partial [Tribonema minus]
MQLAGLYVASGVLVGAAKTCNVAHLHSVWAGPLNQPHIYVNICYEIGAKLARFGDDGSALSWLAPQLRKPDAWPAKYTNA